MFGIDSAVLLGLALILALVAVVVVRSRSTKITTHNHETDDHEDRDPLGPVGDDEFDAVHAGKDHHGGCKFNRDEVRRTAHLVPPPIDLDNLPPRNAVVERLLAAISAEELVKLVSGISGEKSLTVNGRDVVLKSRSSHGEGVYLAMDWLQQVYGMLGIENARHEYTIRGKKYFNLIASKKGKITGTKKVRVFVYGSHLDSTAGNTWTNEKLAPGADDDGSGTIAVLKIAEALKDVELPDDTEIRFCHFTGEEQGLWGSYKYSDACAKAGEDIIAMYQLDMIGYCRNTAHRVDIHDNVNQNGSHELTVAFFRAIAQYGLNLKPVDTHNRAVENRSDHAGFLDHGYKAVLVSEEFTDEGFTPYYHTVEDRVNKFNMPYYVEIIRAMIVVGINFTGATPK